MDYDRRASTHALETLAHDGWTAAWRTFVAMVVVRAACRLVVAERAAE